MRKRVFVVLAGLAVLAWAAGAAFASASGASKFTGLPKAYAHIQGGEVNEELSWNVTDSNVYYDGNGSYCFRNLGFTPKHAQVTLDYWGPANGDIPVITQSLQIGNYTNCGLSEAPQVFVFTGLIDPGVFTDGVGFGFYIVLY
jgi:hypothetical protein